jgi:hypothetical protein
MPTCVHNVTVRSSEGIAVFCTEVNTSYYTAGHFSQFVTATHLLPTTNLQKYQQPTCKHLSDINNSGRQELQKSLMSVINLDWENWNNKHSNSFLMQNMYWVPRTYEISVIFKWNIPIGVTITIFINIFSHNQNTLYEQFYYMTTSFDPECGSLSGHDTRIWMSTETKHHKLQTSPFYIVIDFTLVHFTYIFKVILMYKGKSPTYGIWFLYTLIFLYHGLTMNWVQGQN